MGIDVYARWKDQTEEEKNAQYTGFSTVHGHVGYLREAYHGSPYATQELMPEGFESRCPDQSIDCKDCIDKPCNPKVPAATLRERLPRVLEVVAERERRLYHSSDEDVARVQKSYTDFVELCERKEAETGEPVRIVVSA
jgi:hypothetical protein